MMSTDKSDWALDTNVYSTEISFLGHPNHALKDIVRRFQHDCDKEIVRYLGYQLVLNLELLPECLMIRNTIKRGIIIQLYSGKDSEENISEKNKGAKITSTPLKINSDTSNEHSKEDLDITGSPLECHFAFDKDDLEGTITSVEDYKKLIHPSFSYKGLPLNVARTISSNLIRILSDLSNDAVSLPPIWLACDALDPEKIVFLGVDRLGSVTTLSSVTHSGSHKTRDSLPSIDHLTCHFYLGCPTRLICSSAFALYEVLENVDDGESTLRLSCHWKRPLCILSPPSLDAITSVEVCIGVVDKRKNAELTTLDNLICGLNGGVNWYARSNGESSLSSLLEGYLNALNSYGKVKKEKTDKENYGSPAVDVADPIFPIERQNLEFLDTLWTILMTCESYGELQNGLSQTFDAVASGSIRPYVRGNDKVSEIVRNLKKGISLDVDLEGSAPLEMLIELGLEKIKRDYISAFLAEDLATLEQLNVFLNWSFIEDNYRHCLVKLKQVHVAVVVAGLLKKYLKLPLPVVSHCLCQVFGDLQQNEQQTNFMFHVQVSLVASILNRIPPSMWQLRLKCESDAFTKEMNFSIQKKLEFSPTGKGRPVSEGDVDESVKYFTLAVTSITDAFLP